MIKKTSKIDAKIRCQKWGLKLTYKLGRKILKIHEAIDQDFNLSRSNLSVEVVLIYRDSIVLNLIF
jgi:hypothetical protein